MAQLARHRLHDDFLGVEHAVDDDAEGLAADLGDDDEAAFDVAAGIRVDAEQPAQAGQRQQLVAQPQHRRVLDALDAMIAALARAHQLDHRQAAESRSARRPTSTISAETIASVSGILMVKLEPAPATDFTSMVPPI